MSKRRKEPFPFKQGTPTMASKDNGEKKQDTIGRLEALTLRLNLVLNQNHELQKKLIESNVTISNLEAKVKILELEKSASPIREEYQGQLREVSERYGLDLKFDKIDLLTGTITRGTHNETEGRTEEKKAE